MIFALVQRQAIFWGAARLIDMFVLAVASAAPDATAARSVSPPFFARLMQWQMGVILMAVVLGLIEHRRRREQYLLANLGVTRGQFTVILLVPPLVIESVFAFAMRAL